MRVSWAVDVAWILQRLSGTVYHYSSISLVYGLFASDRYVTDEVTQTLSTWSAFQPTTHRDLLLARQCRPVDHKLIPLIITCGDSESVSGVAPLATAAGKVNPNINPNLIANPNLNPKV